MSEHVPPGDTVARIDAATASVLDILGRAALLVETFSRVGRLGDDRPDDPGYAEYARHFAGRAVEIFGLLEQARQLVRTVERELRAAGKGSKLAVMSGYASAHEAAVGYAAGVWATVWYAARNRAAEGPVAANDIVAAFPAVVTAVCREGPPPKWLAAVVRQESATAALAAAHPGEGEPDRLSFEEQSGSVRLDGRIVAEGLTHDLYALVRGVAEARGKWVAGADLTSRPGLRGKKLIRLTGRLAKPIAALIESKPGRGYRLVLPPRRSVPNCP